MAGRSRPCSLATWSTCVSSTGLFSSARSAFLAAKASLAFVNHLDQQWVHACLAIAGGVVVAAACLVGRWLFNQHQDKQQLHQQHTVIEPAVAAAAAASKCQKNSFWPLRVGGQAAFAGSRRSLVQFRLARL